MAEKSGPRTTTKGADKPRGASAKSGAKTARQASREEAGTAGAAARPPAKVTKAKVPFPRKNQPPTEAEFLARLPLPIGKKFDGVRTFLKKQKGVAEDLYFYGPKTGWAFRYLRGSHSLATVMIHADHLMGIVALDAAAMAQIDFSSLSEIGQRARKMAHGSPSLLWLDLPLDGAGASDFKALLKSKLKVLPPAGPPPPPQPRA